MISSSAIAPLDAKEKILEVARDLFAHNGYEVTSLRAITAKAEVNLASVNYHFGSKVKLIAEILSQAFRPLTEARLNLLEKAVLASHPQKPTLEAVLEAFIRPCLEMCSDPSKETTVKLFERALAEEKEVFAQVIERDINPSILKFSDAFAKALPDVPREEILWRLHFTIGTVIHTTCHHRDLFSLPGMTCKLDKETALQRIITYTAAGFRAELKKGAVAA